MNPCFYSDQGLIQCTRVAFEETNPDKMSIEASFIDFKSFLSSKHGGEACECAIVLRVSCNFQDRHPILELALSVCAEDVRWVSRLMYPLAVMTNR